MTIPPSTPWSTTPWHYRCQFCGGSVQYGYYHVCPNVITHTGTNPPQPQWMLLAELIETKLRLAYQAMLTKKPDPIEGEEPTYDDALEIFSQIIKEMT